jgi:hypothetical protein
MNKHSSLRFLATCFALLLMSLATATAQLKYLDVTNIFNGFDTGGNTAIFAGSGMGSVGGWNLWYGQGGTGNVDGQNIGFNNVPAQCDPTQNSPDPEDTNASGALLISVESWNNGTGDGGTTGVWFGQFKDDYIYDTGANSWFIDANLYQSISFDIMVSNTIAPDTNGNFGTLGVGFIAENTPGGGQTYGNPTIPVAAQGHWQHIVVPLTNAIVDANTICGWCFKFGNTTYPALGAKFVMWLDNVRVNVKSAVPPPTMGRVIPAIPGMNLWMIGTDTNQQEDLESATQGGNGWQLATSNNPVEYKLTISPQAVPPSPFRTFVIINTDNLPVYRNQPDASAVSMAEMDIVSAGNGAATGYFRYRINDTNGYNATVQNTNVFGPDTGTNGTLASVAGTLGGTWTLRFTSPSNGLIIAPNGATSPGFTLNSNAVLAFSETANPVDAGNQSLSLYIGASPNGSAGLGQEVVLTDFTMTGNASAFEDNFATDTGPAPGTDWIGGAGVSQYVGTTIQIPVSANGPDVWVENTLPSVGFDLLGTTQIPTTNWVLLTGTNSLLTDTGTSLALGATQIAAIPIADVEGLPAPVPTNSLFFEMIKNQGGNNQ